MIIGTLRLLPLPDRRLQVLEVLQSVQGLVLAQPGCAGCSILEEQGLEQAVVLMERWESDTALRTHIRSDAYRRILGACELSSAPPEFRFDEVSATQGIELVERSLMDKGTPVPLMERTRP
jgi:quinol monooxygenase YgiN